jgi:hypothetical protein
LAHAAQHVQPNHFGLPIQLFLQPVHDGLGHQAGASEIGVEIQYDWLTGRNDPVQVV